MLQISNRLAAPVAEAAPQDSLSERLVEIRSFLRRELSLIALTTGICVALGILYLLMTPPSFTAVTTLVIDTRKVQLFQQQSLFSETAVDAGAVETQVEILKSENIALKVIKDLHLEDDEEFGNAGPSLIGTVLGWIFDNGQTVQTDNAHVRQAVRIFQTRLGVRRIGLTYVMEVSFRSLDRERSAQIANAVANAYVVDQLEAKYNSARRAGVWLQDRLKELREQASNAERAIVDYKTRNDIVDTGGRLMNEQQLAEINSQLTIARAATSEAHAKLDRIRSILDSPSITDGVAATVADTLKNDVITKLRSKYLDLSAQEAEISRRYGFNHQAALNLRNQMKEIENSVRNELQRIAESFKSEVEIATQRQEGLQKQLDDVVSQSQVKNEAQVKLRELESNSQSYRALYDNFLQRYVESVQQQSFPITEARIISAASRPLSKSHPKTLLTLVVAAFGGLLIGIGIGAWRDVFDNVFRSSEQVERLLQTECIAIVPLLESNRPDAKGQQTKRARMRLRMSRKSSQPRMTLRSLSSAIIEAPFSAVAENVRAIKVAIDQQSANVPGGKIIGVTSSMPHEGKSSISIALAALIAQSGARVILVDCDLRNSALSQSLAPNTDAGLLELMDGRGDFNSVFRVDPRSGMKFLPVGARDNSVSSEVLSSKAIKTLFERLRHQAEYVIVDLPPIAPIVDVRAASNLVDSYIYVVEWGVTRVEVVQQTLRSAKDVQEHLIGVVLNKADTRSLETVDGYSDGYYSEQMTRYGIAR
jgi:succinoglycan biosynthesis transport protein ExoP